MKKLKQSEQEEKLMNTQLCPTSTRNYADKLTVKFRHLEMSRTEARIVREQTLGLAESQELK
jgi:hypothetical protein